MCLTALLVDAHIFMTAPNVEKLCSQRYSVSPKDLHDSALCLGKFIDSFSSQLIGSPVDWRVVGVVVQLTMVQLTDLLWVLLYS